MRSARAVLCLALLAVTAGRAAAAEKMADHKITQAVSYVGFDPIYCTFYEDGRPAGTLLISVGLDIPDPKLRKRVLDGLPVLQDAYVRSMMTFTAVAVRPLVQPDIDLVARRLQGVTDRALGQSGAKLLMGQLFLRVTR